MFGLFIAAIVLRRDNCFIFMIGAAIIPVFVGTLASFFISDKYTYVLAGLRGILWALKVSRRG